MKYFTKSKFKDALFCPTTLNYVDDEKYTSTIDENTFLKGIAEGGYQVEYLAKSYYPTGIDLSMLNILDNAHNTEKLINENENVILFEPVFIVDKYLVRCDILEKEGNTIKIYEVKAKSFDFENGISQFLNQRSKGYIKSEWLYQLMDVYFQKFVLNKKYNSKYTVKSYLMMCDKNKEVTVDGLNQKFLVNSDNKVEIDYDAHIGDPIMDKVLVDEVFELGYMTMNSFSLDSNELDVLLSKIKKREDKEEFILDNYQKIDDYIETLYNIYINKTPVYPLIKSKCKTCNYYIKNETDEKKSGFLECWNKVTSISKEDLSIKPTILDIWNYRKKDDYINEGIYLIEDIQLNDINQVNEKFNSINGDGLSTNDRQLLQLSKTINHDDSIFVDKVGLKEEMSTWKYPLNMIDFETTAVALPFTKGIKPYESIAFQYSHHLIHKDGKVEHKSQFLNLEPGKFPSFDFIRVLKKDLEQNDGTIFMYSPHENTILNLIFRQLGEGIGQNEPDRIDLMKFIISITYMNEKTLGYISRTDVEALGLDRTESIYGERYIKDLWAFIKKYYYNPLTNGSNSIKDILPSILNQSSFLKDKYSKPVYGTDEISSMNFENKIWIEFDDNNKIINPYKQLPTLYDDSYSENFITSDSLANGGDAMIAYAKAQFTQMTPEERTAIFEGLLRYCELDTLAMVMIYEHWKNDLNL
jgi:hypothetical protein